MAEASGDELQVEIELDRCSTVVPYRAGSTALTDDEVAEGWVLTCQSLPTTPLVRVVYE